MPFVEKPVDIDHLIRLYNSGNTCQDLAHIFGVSDATLRRRLRAAGITIRQGPSYRTTDSEATKRARAATRSRRCLHSGPHESNLAGFLDDMGIR